MEEKSELQQQDEMGLLLRVESNNEIIKSLSMYQISIPVENIGEIVAWEFASTRRAVPYLIVFHSRHTDFDVE